MDAPAHDPDVAEAFRAHRRLLFSIAYRMTGSAADADELVQDAFVRLIRASTDGVRDVRALLITTVTRLALDRLALARTERETYWGTWLPEPVATGDVLGPDEVATRRDSLGLGVLRLLERLSPVERAVFVLREAFALPFAEIADVLAVPEATCRQHLRRARTRVAEPRPRFAASREQVDALVRRFVAAADGRDPAALQAMLADDVVLRADGGRKASAAKEAIQGASAVAAFLAGIARLAAGACLDVVDVNGAPALLSTVEAAEGPVVTGLCTLRMDADGRAAEVSIVRNPDKLSRMAVLARLH